MGIKGAVSLKSIFFLQVAPKGSETVNALMVQREKRIENVFYFTAKAEEKPVKPEQVHGQV